MKIAIAIPTFNRAGYLKKAVQSIFDQEHDGNIEVYVVISNIASTDETSSYLDELNKAHENVIVYNQPEDNLKYSNLYFLGGAIPEEMDWVWLMGDDDYLMQKNSVQIVCEYIREYRGKDLCFIHACQGRRSRSTGQVRVEEIFNLCNEFGYHEMLGWFSSIVLRKCEFVESMLESKDVHHYIFSESLEDRSKASAFSHSASIYKECVGKYGMFVDSPLVETQESRATKETAERWAAENTSERYLFVADDLQRLRETGLIEHNFSRSFFKYLNWNFWDIWFRHLMLELTDNNKTLTQLNSDKFLSDWNSNLDRVMKVTDFMEDKTDSRNLSLIYVSLKYAVSKLAQSDFSDEFVVSMLVDQIKMLTVPSYELEIIQQHK
ncbi:MAG: glycosyltransferase [Verrucomicrobia bacterium]|jgi:glycosyltransferase involved in cell wall biosynthesis|nr:glycosyltransferase [Verrucomicrobiota bacterium]